MDASQQEPTLVPAPGFDASSDALTLRDAMWGIGTDEKAIIGVLATRTNLQRVEIATKFRMAFEKDLDVALETDVGGSFGRVCKCLALPLSTLFAQELQRAMARPGTNEGVLIEILSSRSNLEVRQILEDYQRLFERSLAEDIESETSGDFKQLLLVLLKAERDEPHVKPFRDELPAPQPSEERATSQAEKLYAAGEGRMGTSESAFNLILGTQSYAQLRLTASAYQVVYDQPLEQAVRRETHGDYQDALLAMVALATNPAAYFAERLHRAMRGPGTHDKDLTRLIVSRAEIDMASVKREYARLYETPLEKDVAGDTSGHYRKLLLRLIGAGSG